MASSFYRIEETDGIAVLVIDRPPVNALDLEVARDLEAALLDLETAPSVRAVVLTGAGETFCAGLDLRRLPAYTLAEQDLFLTAINRLLYRLYGFPKPAVAAVNGSAVAGGLVLVLACDYRIGLDTTSRLGLAEVKVGVPYPLGAREICRGELSPPTARLLMLGGAMFGTKTAVARGILDETETARRLLPRALERAAELASMPATSYALIKRQQRAGALARMREAAEHGAEPLLGGWITPETARALSASLSRRR